MRGKSHVVVLIWLADKTTLLLWLVEASLRVIVSSTNRWVEQTEWFILDRLFAFFTADTSHEVLFLCRCHLRGNHEHSTVDNRQKHDRIWAIEENSLSRIDKRICGTFIAIKDFSDASQKVKLSLKYCAVIMDKLSWLLCWIKSLVLKCTPGWTISNDQMVWGRYSFFIRSSDLRGRSRTCAVETRNEQCESRRSSDLHWT